MAGRAVQGTIIIIDIDKMEETVDERGWSRYRPNPATGRLTGLVERFASRWGARVLYGLDYDRGTEEAVMEIPLVDPWEVERDLVEIAKSMEEEGVTVTIVAVSGPVGVDKPRDRREAYSGPRRRVARILRSLKRRGGAVVYIEGRIVYRSPK